MRNWQERAFRIVLALFLFVGHGTPKLLSWLFGITAWGAHANFTPKNFSAGLSAVIEFVCPILIILGVHVRWAAVPLVMMFVGVAFAGPLPWFHMRVPVEGYALPFSVIVSKEITLVYALAYTSLVLFAKNQDLQWQKR